MKKVILSILVSLGLISCGDKLEVNIAANGQITIVDSTAHAGQPAPYDSTSTMAFYPVYFIGELSDTFHLSSQPVSMFSTRQLEEKYRLISNWTFPDSGKMQIRVDTGFDLAYRKIFYSSEVDLEEKPAVDSVINYKAFPVFIHNQSDSVFSVGSHNAVGYLIREARNRQGQWVPLESPVEYFCGTGKRDLILEPNQLLLAKLVRYQGDYRTQCRLKFTRWKQTVYSNTFVDFINESQLQNQMQNIE